MEDEKDFENEEMTENASDDLKNYDSDGNYSIPDDDEGAAEESEEDTEEESSEEKPGEDPKEEREEDEKTPEEEPKKETPKEDGGKGEEIEALQARIKELEHEKNERDSEHDSLMSLLKEALPKLGAKSDNPHEALIELIAETLDKSPEEYKQEIKEKERIEKALALLEKTELEKTVSEDFQILKNSYPELRACKTIMDIPNVKEFARFRDLGLNAIQAYSAANPEEIRKSVAAAVKRQNLNDTKTHLRSSAAKSSKGSVPNISQADLELMRGAFPGKSDREIYDLYRKVTK